MEKFWKKKKNFAFTKEIPLIYSMILIYIYIYIYINFQWSFNNWKKYSLFMYLFLNKKEKEKNHRLAEDSRIVMSVSCCGPGKGH